MRKRGKSTVTVYFMKYEGADIHNNENIIGTLNWGFDKPVPREGEYIHFHYSEEGSQEVDSEAGGAVYRVDYDYINVIDTILDVSIFCG